jgi:hypothetical protein
MGHRAMKGSMDVNIDGACDEAMDQETIERAMNMQAIDQRGINGTLNLCKQWIRKQWKDRWIGSKRWIRKQAMNQGTIE